MNLDLKQMSHEEKLKTMHALWEDLAREDDLIESPAWHEQALQETEQRLEAGVEHSRDWEEAKKGLGKRPALPEW